MSKLTVIKGQDLKWRLIRSLALLFSYIVHGSCLGMIGPTMLDIQIRTNSSIVETSYIIIGRAIGMSIGTFVSGPMSNLLGTQYSISIAMIAAAITTAGVPWPKDIRATIGIFVFNGFFYGIEETCLYLYMIFMWGIECETFIQALHFSFGVGGTIAPLIAREFLLPRNDSYADAHINEWTPDDVRIHYCYEIVAICCFIVSIIFIILGRCAPETLEHPSRSEEDVHDEGHANGRPSIAQTMSMIEADKHQRLKTLITRIVCICSTCLFLFFYCGVEVNFGTFISPYAIEGPLHMTKSEGALMASLFWFIFTFSRIFTIFYIQKIGSKYNLILCTIILIISNIVLVPFPDNRLCLYIGTVLVGIGTSSIYASIFGFIELSIKMTPLITSLHISFACLGMSIFPILTSQLFEADKKIFLYLTLMGTVAMIILLIVIIISFNYYAKLVIKSNVVVNAEMVNINDVNVNNMIRDVKPSFGRLNSIMSIQSNVSSKKGTLRKRGKKFTDANN